MEENKEKQMFIQRKVDNFRTRTIKANELNNYQLEDDDTLCEDDGRNQWIAYKDFKTEEEQVEEEDLPNSIKEPYNQAIKNETQQEQVHSESTENEDSEGIKPVEPETTPALPQPDSNPPVKFRKLWIILTIVGVILGGVAVYRFLPEVPKKDDTTSIIQSEMERALNDGDRLVSQSDHEGANVKFSQVMAFIDSKKGLDLSKVNEFGRKYKDKADSLCSPKNDSTISFTSNEYYKHAGILLEQEPKECPYK